MGARTRMPILFHGARIALAAGLLFTAMLKFRDADGGRVQHTWVSQIGGPYALVLVGVGEVILAALLFTGLWRLSSFAVFSVLSVYAVVLAYMAMQGEPAVACGCFGTWRAPIGVHVAMLLGLLLASRVLICQGSEPRLAG